MRIIFATPSPFPYYAGGVETWMYNIIKRIANENEIIVLAPEYHTMEKVFKDIPENVRFVTYDCLRSHKLIRPFMRGQFGCLDNFYRQTTLKKQLIKLLEATSDLTYVFSVDPIFIGPVVAKLKNRYTNMRFITSIRGPHLDIISKSYPLLKKRFSKNEKISVTQCHLILVNGKDSKALYESKYAIETHVQKNGVDIQRVISETTDGAPEINDNENSILSVATLIPIKGVFDLIDAGKVYREKFGGDFKLYFVGKGDQKKLYDYAEKSGIRNNIICLGHRDNPIPYMKKTKINACVSGGGGFTMSMLEAMASQKPVVALDTSLYRQFNDYNQLPLVAEKDPDALADKLHDMIVNYNEYKKDLDLSMKVAKNFDWSIVSGDLLNYLRQIGD